MSDELKNIPTQKKYLTVQRKSPTFQEAPGEAEADSVRDAFLQGSAPDAVGSTLDHADPTTRAQVVNRLQEERGNAYVQRVVGEAQGTPGRMVGLPQSEMVDAVLQRKGSGEALAEPARGRLESSLGAGLDGVRVHADGTAAELSRELNAQAFTVGSDVFFAEGQYNPSSSEGQGLLAHELTHVAQQTGLPAKGVQRQAAPEEEEQVQRQEAPEEEEEQVQRQAEEEEEPESGSG